ncbi:MAG: glutamate 5-kinase [Alphaproteobacteria bacterium]|nr:glutamate 5-kinase [Alphaproteobacteria bacterium]
MTDPATDRAVLTRARRVVVKVGTGVVARADGRLALGRMGALVEQIRALQDDGREVLLVSSGAVGLGAERLGLERRPQSIVDRQACAAAGQSSLMAFYDSLFGRLGGRCAQVLLTEDDFQVRHRYVHLAATLSRLLALGVVPVINENDTVSTVELALTGPTVFGDNDRLSALVASGLAADLLVLLTDVDGVYDRPPTEPGAARVSTWQGAPVRLGSGSSLGRGGMGAKLTAAQVGASAGVHVVVAGGTSPDVLPRILAGHDVGTWFPATDRPSSKRRWLALATAPAGRLVVNAGARQALVGGKASLLQPGVVAVDGDFEAGAIVSICAEDGTEVARGRCDRDADALRADLAGGVSGRGKALVHRDQVVILAHEPADAEETP